MKDSNKKKLNDINPDVLNLSKEPIFNEIDEEPLNELKAITYKIFGENTVQDFCRMIPINSDNGQITYLDYKYDGTEDDMGVVGLNVQQKFIQLQDYYVSALMGREQIQDLKTFGIDAISLTENTLINEAKKGVAKEAMKKIDELGEQSYLDTLSKWDKFKSWLWKIFKKKYIKYQDVKNNPRLLIAKILNMSYQIAVDTRRGPGTAVILSPGLGTVIQDAGGFISDKENVPLPGTTTTIYPIGKMDDLTFYIDANRKWNDNAIHVVRKPDDSSPGLWIPWHEHGVTIQTIAEGSMAPKITLRLRYSIIEVGDAKKFVKKIYVKNMKL